MTTRNKTLYDILGIENNAGEKEIQKAFRRLAKTLHPDVNKSEDAGDKFREVQEAYEILSDENLRKEYDKRLSSGDYTYDPVAFKDIFDMFFAGEWKPEQAVNGEHIDKAVQITAEQLLRAASLTIELNKTRACNDCNGRGEVRSNATCTECAGKGGAKVVKRTPFGKLETFQKCTVCSGSGKMTSAPCMTCTSKGILPHREEFEFQVNPMCMFGDIMVFKGKGHAGRDGGLDGDLRIKLEQSPYDKIEVIYDVDLKEQKTIPLQTYLEGKPYHLIFPDGTEEDVKVSLNSQLSFPDKGLFDKNGKRGIYNLSLTVSMPELSNAQRETIIKALGAN